MLLLRPATSPVDYDLNLLTVTVQGLLNTREPRVMIEKPIIEKRHDILGTEHWLGRLQQPGRWLADREVERIGFIDELIKRHADEISGLVIFDPDVDASSNVAVSLAAKEGLAVTGPDGLAWLAERGITLTVRHDLRGKFQGKTDAHRWMIEHCVRGRRDLVLMSYVMDAYCRATGGEEMGMDIEGMDMVVASKGVAFDLSPWCDEIPVDDPSQKMGTDRLVWNELFRAASEARWGESPLEVTGFPFWQHKYTDWNQAGGTRRPHEAEWEAVWQMTPWGAILTPLIAPNMSFHRWGSLPKGLTQPDPGAPPPLENKTYVCLHLGDFDGGFGLYRRFPPLWMDARRGELPLGWGINPNLARHFPDLIDEIWATRTPNDHFVADASSAGYVNPSRFLDLPDDGHPAPADPLDLWRRFCRHWYQRLDYTLSPMVLDQRHPPLEILDAFQSFSPEGIAFILEGICGRKVPPLVPRLWKGMPVTNLHNMSAAKRDEDMADVMLQFAKDDPTDQPAFHIFRFEWRKPSNIFDSFAEVKRRAAPREWVALHPLQWFRLLAEHLRIAER